MERNGTTAPAPAPTSPDPGPGPSAPSAPARIDTDAYLRDRQQQDADRRAGTPAPAPVAGPEPAAEPPAPAPTVDRPVSKRQEKINEYERTIAALNERIARLEGPVAGRPPAAPAPPAAEPVTKAEYKRYLELPDAPKLDDFESIAEHTAAMALFIADRRWEDHSRAAARGAEVDALTESQRQRADGFAGRLKEASTADPTFWDHVSEDVATLKPIAALMPGERMGPHNIVAEEIMTSPVAPHLMRELSKPGVLARLVNLPDALKNLPPAQRAREHSRFIVREIGKLEGKAATAAAPAPDPPKLVTDNPPPPSRLGTKPNVPDDPIAASLKKKDTGAYLEARRQQDIAKMGKR